MENMLIRPETK